MSTHDTGGQVNSVINNKASSQHMYISKSVTRALIKDEPCPDNGINRFLLLGTQLPRCSVYTPRNLS
jgi:hypothetical protein